jgi:hypothetical protein
LRSTLDQPLPADTEARLASFTELVAKRRAPLPTNARHDRLRAHTARAGHRTPHPAPKNRSHRNRNTADAKKNSRPPTFQNSFKSFRSRAWCN